MALPPLLTPLRPMRAGRTLLGATAAFLLCGTVTLFGAEALRGLESDVTREARIAREAREAAFEIVRASAERDEAALAPIGNPLARLRRLVPRDDTELIGAAERAGARFAEARAAPDAAHQDAALGALRSELDETMRIAERRVEQAAAQGRARRNALYLAVAGLAVLTAAAAGAAAWGLRAEQRSWRRSFALLSEARNEAEAARAEANASNLAKSRFLAAASHDMRQPLHALVLYISAMKRRVSGAEQQDIVDKMERSANALSGMFATLLDLARIDAGAVEPKVSVFSLQESIESAASQFPGAAIHLPDPPAEAMLRLDRVLFERILRNLISNALLHGGGETWIEAGIEGGRALVSVVDRGPGIAEADIARIFDEFVRLESGARAEGLGLGLAIVSRIARLIGAEVDVQATPGEGARFTVRTPLADVAPEAAPAPAQHAVALRGARVIAVDDEPLVLEAMANALRDAGADVRTYDGESVLAAASDGWAPNAIVTDFRIAGSMSGVRIAQAASQRYASAPKILVVTGDTSPDSLELLEGFGLPWLVKPVHPHELVRAVSALIVSAT